MGYGASQNTLEPGLLIEENILYVVLKILPLGFRPICTTLADIAQCGGDNLCDLG